MEKNKQALIEKNTRYRFYFPRDRIYDTTKFTNKDWDKWYRDKALLDYLHCESEMFKTKPGTKERHRLADMVGKLASRFVRLDDQLDDQFEKH